MTSSSSLLVAAPVPHSKFFHEATRRFAVRAVFFIFLLSLIEAPLRKWFLPSFAGPLTLLRDPFVIILYAYWAAYRLFTDRGLVQIWLGFAYITIIFGLVQYALAGHSLGGWILGVRTYWLYMPLSFIAAVSFRPRDLEHFLRMVLIIAIPYSFLVAIQYNAPSGAFINWGVAGDAESLVGVVTDIVRPFGLFSHSGLNAQYTAFTIAAFTAFYTKDSVMRHRGLFLLATGTAVGIMSVLTGSRSIYFFAGFILLLTAFGILRARPTIQSLRTALGLLFFVVLAGLLLTLNFPDMLAAMSTRFDEAALSEGRAETRVFSIGFGWIDVLKDAPILGYGIGAGASGVAQYLGLEIFAYGENDLDRNINELGVILGLFFVLIRWGTAGWMLVQANRLARRGYFYALPLAGFAVPAFFFGSITHSPLSAMLPWLTLGLLVSGTSWRKRKTVE